MKNIVHDFILKMFVSKDELRPKICAPSKENDFIISTDGHSIIRIPEKNCFLKYTETENYPKNINKMFYEFEHNEIHTIPVNDFLSQIFKCELQYETELCNECNGSGEKKCECCGKDGDCNECDGYGVVESSFPFKKMQLSGEKVKWFGKTINPAFLYRVYNTAINIGAKTIHIQNNNMQNNENSKLMFSIGDIDIIVMCMFLKD